MFRHHAGLDNLVEILLPVVNIGETHGTQVFLHGPSTKEGVLNFEIFGVFMHGLR